MSTRTISRTKARKPMTKPTKKPAPTPPARQATARTAGPRADEPREVVAPFRAANALRAEREAVAVEAKPAVLREPEPKAAPRSKRSDTPGVHIKVNDQHFGPEDRLPKAPSAREIGALVGMPEAKVRWLTAPEGARNIPGRVELVDGAVFEAV